MYSDVSEGDPGPDPDESIQISSVASAIVGVDGLRCEYLIDPLGIDELAPRLGWRIRSETRGVVQTAFRVEVATSTELLLGGAPDLWDTGRVVSRESQHIAYAGAELRSRLSCKWRVTVWVNCTAQPVTSAPASFEIGLLKPSDWIAGWIEDPARRPANAGRPSYFRRQFELPARVLKGRAYCAALGLYTAEVNGRSITNDVFRPGWTDYGVRTQYQVYDITALLNPGPNAIGVILGDGWYSGHVGWLKPGVYGAVPRLRTQLEVDCEDGSRVVVGTDGAWRCSFGPIRRSDLLMGETYDARLERPDWSMPGRRTPGWRRGHEVIESTRLVAQRNESARRTEELPGNAIGVSPDGERLFDMGQNMVGRVRFGVQGVAGQRIRIRHGEMLTADGNLYTDNLRAAKATDTYICRGQGTETYEPAFTFHGFRYVGVSGLSADQAVGAVGIVIHSDAAPAGTLMTSNELLNQLQRNITWSQRGNFLEVPTDCPQRDERAGWMGDAQIFARTATFNMDVAAFFTKWMQDIGDSQDEDGAFTDISPALRVLPDGSPWPTAAPAWGDAGVIVPWTVHLAYGDRRIIERNFAAMSDWIDFIIRANPDYLWRHAAGHNYGDWLAIDEETPRDLLATAYLAYSTGLVAAMAEIIERPKALARYRRVGENIVAAFNNAFVRANGRLTCETQTGYALALHFDLLPVFQRAAAARRLVRLIEDAGRHLRTGFIGVSYVMPVLARFGHLDLAYQLLTDTTFPSWGYSIVRGATTMWERWDGWTEERGFAAPEMNSFNHYALGSVGAWLFNTIGGIDVDHQRPGYARVVVAPRPGGGLTHARTRYESHRGPILSAWQVDAGDLRFEIEIPANSDALVTLPAHGPDAILESDRALRKAGAMTVRAVRKREVELLVGSGRYNFRCLGAADLVSHPRAAR